MAAALLATLWRVGWEVRCAVTWVDDTGRVIELLADPPVFICNLMRQSVRRWRLARIAVNNRVNGVVTIHRAVDPPPGASSRITPDVTYTLNRGVH